MKLASELLLEEQSTTPNIDPGLLAVYAKSDGHLYSLGDTGAEGRHPPIATGLMGPSSPKTGALWLATGVGPVSTPGNFSVGPEDPLLTTAGMWVQTGLGAGNDFTIWIEDGT